MYYIRILLTAVLLLNFLSVPGYGQSKVKNLLPVDLLENEDRGFIHGSTSLSSRAVANANIHNPDLAQGCPNNIILILDESSSIVGAGGATNVSQQVRDGAYNFLRSIKDSDAQVAVIEFNGHARISIPYTTVTTSSLDTFHTYLYGNPNNMSPSSDFYDPEDNGGGGQSFTNWEDALLKAKSINDAGLIADLVFLFTDGNPTAFNSPDICDGCFHNPMTDLCYSSDSPCSTKALDAAVPIATSIMNQGSHIFCIGMSNPSINESNIRALVGPDKYGVEPDFKKADYMELSNTDDLAQAFNTVALELCGIDLEVQTTASSSSVMVCGQMSFEVVIKNVSDNLATSIILVDTLPSGYSYVSSSVTRGIYNPITYMWSLDSIPAQSGDTLILQAIVEPTGDYTNCAQVFSVDQEDIDSTPGNNIPSEDDHDCATVQVCTPVFSTTSDITVGCSENIEPSYLRYSYTNGCTEIDSTLSELSGTVDVCTGGTYTETWTHMYCPSNSIQQSRTIAVPAAPAPIFIEIPTDTIVACDSGYNGRSILYTNQSNVACAINGSVTSSLSGVSDACGGSKIETWTYTDPCGRTISTSRTVTVATSTVPTFMELPLDTTIVCSDTYNGRPLSYTNNDGLNCSISGTVTSTLSGVSDACGGTKQETWTYTDVCGRTITHSRSINILPSTLPEFLPSPADTTVACGSTYNGRTLGYSNNDSSSCFIDGIVASSVSGTSTSCGGTKQETWTYVDICGRTITTARKIYVEPSSIPVFIETPLDTIISCSSSYSGRSVLVSNSETADCHISNIVVSSITGNTQTCGGNKIETWLYMDPCGREITMSRTITLQSAIAPAFLNPPTDTIISCMSTYSGRELKFENGQSAECSIQGTVASTISGETELCSEMKTETWTYTDICGRTISHSRLLQVQESTAPQFIEFPIDTIIPCINSYVGRSISYSNSDPNCTISGQVLSQIEVITLGTCGGIANEKWSYTDICGRKIEHTRVIETLPALKPSCSNIPTDTIISCSSDYNGRLLTISNMADGICKIESTVHSTIEGNSNLCGGHKIEHWVYTDPCGREISISRNIEVQESLQPAFIEIPQDTSIQCDSGYSGRALNYTNSELENCNISGSVVGNLSGTYDMCGGELIEFWSYTDACGRLISTSRIITVLGASLPNFVEVPQDTTIGCTSEYLGRSLIYDNSQNESCNIYGSVVSTMSGNTTSCGGSRIETWTYTDSCGNTQSIDRTIFIDPPTLPAFMEIPQDTIIACTSEYLGRDLYFSNNAEQDCLISGSITSSISGSNPACGGNRTERWEYTDLCGRTIVAERMIGVEPAALPDLPACPKLTSITCDEAFTLGIDSYPIISSSNQIQGTCNVTIIGVPYAIDNSLVTCDGSGVLRILYQVNDNCGRVYDDIICEQTVQQAAPPIFENIPSDYIISINDPIPSGTEIFFGNGASGVCGLQGSVIGEVTGTPEGCGDFYTETWEIEICGYTLSASRKIYVAQDEVLEIVPSSETIVECDGNGNMTDIEYWLNANGGLSLTTEVQNVIWSHNYQSIPTSCGSIEVLFTAEDECGNKVSESSIFTIQDTQAPSIVPSHPLIAQIPNGGTLPVQCYGMDPSWDVPEADASFVEASDICDKNLVVSFSSTLVDEGECTVDGYKRKYLWTWTTQDACNNIADHSIFMQIVDTIPPVIHNVEMHIEVDCLDDLIIEAVYATDECQCAEIHIEDTPLNEGCLNNQVITRTYTATDCCGNTSEAIQYIKITDTHPLQIVPTHVLIADKEHGDVISYDCNDASLIAAYDQLGVDDLEVISVCGAPFSKSFEVLETTGACNITGFLERKTLRWSITDACGDESKFDIIIEVADTIAPVFLDIAPVICVDSLTEAPSIYAVDACSNTHMVFYDTEKVDSCGREYIERRYEAKDLCDNYSHATQQIYIRGSLDIEVSKHNTDILDLQSGDRVTRQCTSMDGSGMGSGFSASDITVKSECSAENKVFYRETITSPFTCTDGIATAQALAEWYIHDICGQEIVFSLIVDLVDNETPALEGFKEELWVSCSDSLIMPDMLSTCSDVDIHVSYRDTVVGSCPSLYSYFRTIVLTDVCGVNTSYDQRIHVVDEEAPVFENIVQSFCLGGQEPELRAKDNCMDGYLPIKLVSEERFECNGGEKVHKTWSATDHCGNESRVEQVVIAFDTLAPELLYFNPIVEKYAGILDQKIYMSDKEAMASLQSIGKNAVVGFDSCDPHLRTIYDVKITVSEDCKSDGYIESRMYTWEFSDACGNTTAVEMGVYIIDDLGPEIVKAPRDTIIYCGTLPDITPVVFEDASKYTVDFKEEQLDNVYLRIWTATDLCGNTTIHEQKITMNDSDMSCAIVPEKSWIDCNSHNNIIRADVLGGQGPYTYEWEALSGICFIQGDSNTEVIRVYIGFTTVDLQVTITDAHGCKTVCTYTLVCSDNEPETYVETAATFIAEDPSGRNMDERQDSKSIHVYPNPTIDDVHIKYESEKNGHVSIQAYNALGQLIHTDKSFARKGMNQITVDMRNWAPGLYILYLFDGDTVNTIEVLRVGK